MLKWRNSSAYLSDALPRGNGRNAREMIRSSTAAPAGSAGGKRATALWPAPLPKRSVPVEPSSTCVSHSTPDQTAFCSILNGLQWVEGRRWLSHHMESAPGMATLALSLPFSSGATRQAPTQPEVSEYVTMISTLPESSGPPLSPRRGPSSVRSMPHPRLSNA